MTSEKNRLKIVLDTNVFISALLFGGIPYEIMELAREGRITVLTSANILFELASVLQQKFNFSVKMALGVVSEIKRLSVVVFVKSKFNIVKSDPQDNKVLECAVDGKADLIITGDKKHLLPIKHFREIKIKSPRDFIKEYDY